MGRVRSKPTADPQQPRGCEWASLKAAESGGRSCAPTLCSRWASARPLPTQRARVAAGARAGSAWVCEHSHVGTRRTPVLGGVGRGPQGQDQGSQAGEDCQGVPSLPRWWPGGGFWPPGGGQAPRQRAGAQTGAGGGNEWAAMVTAGHEDGVTDRRGGLSVVCWGRGEAEGVWGDVQGIRETPGHPRRLAEASRGLQGGRGPEVRPAHGAGSRAGGASLPLPKPPTPRREPHPD